MLGTETEQKPYKFVKVKRNDIPDHMRVNQYGKRIDTYWALHIDTEERLLTYLQNDPNMIQAISDVWDRIIGRSKLGLGGGHWRNQTSLVIAQSLFGLPFPDSKELEAFKKQISLIELTDHVNKTFNKGKVDMFLKEGEIMVNSVGGMYCPKWVEQEILDTIESDELIFPEEERIKVSQWVEGKHWYAKVDKTTVEWKGRTKWDTREQALECALKFQKKKDDKKRGKR